MTERARLYAATGNAVARISVGEPADCSVELALPGSGAGCLAIDPRDPDRLYAGTFEDGVYISEDAGASWRAPDSGPGDRRVLALAVSSAHERAGTSVVYAGTEPSNLYRSEDAGRSWRLLPALRELPSEPTWSFPGRPWTHHVRTIALHPTDPEWLLVGVELGGVMRSTDGGASWADHNPEAHSDAHRLLTHPLAPERVYEAAGQGVAVSEDRGLTWTPHERGLDRRYAWAAAIDPADPDLWYVSISRGPFAAHGDGDGEARVVRRADGRWSPVAGWGDAPELRRMPYALATLPDRPRALVAGLRGGRLLLSEDAGESWTSLAAELPDLVDLVAAPAG
ncbi:MAG: hypothetical protein GEU88_05645 [Solirubrobacterales bacterium]|nr:hypothetical protein [Solirubrobacterales bacterium]